MSLTDLEAKAAERRRARQKLAWTFFWLALVVGMWVLRR